MRKASYPDQIARIDSIDAGDVEVIGEMTGGWSGEYLQMDRGTVRYQSRRLVLAGVAVRSHACDRRVLVRAHNAWGALNFVRVLGGDTAARYQGRELRARQPLMIHAGREHEVIAPAGCRAWDVDVSAAVVEARGWQVAPEALPVIPAARLDRLERVGRAVGQRVARNLDRGLTGSLVLALRDQILDAMERELGPLLLGGPARADASRPTRGAELADAVMRRMREVGAGGKPRIAEISREFGVPERTVYQAFRDWVGVGPYEFHRLEKLHRFRSVLAGSRATRGQITRAAGEAGFHDTSRMTQAYRRQFGETPRASIGRWEHEGAWTLRKEPRRGPQV